MVGSESEPDQRGRRVLSPPPSTTHVGDGRGGPAGERRHRQAVDNLAMAALLPFIRPTTALPMLRIGHILPIPVLRFCYDGLKSR